MNGSSWTSQLVQFQDFLLKANKYNCLKMVGDGGATDRKLILVEVCTTPSTEAVMFLFFLVRNKLPVFLLKTILLYLHLLRNT